MCLGEIIKKNCEHGAIYILIGDKFPCDFFNCFCVSFDSEKNQFKFYLFVSARVKNDEIININFIKHIFYSCASIN